MPNHPRDELIEKLLLVGFENVQRFDMARLDNDVRIVIYVGASQKSVPIELVKRLQELGGRVEWQKVEGIRINWNRRSLTASSTSF